jgi:hypothetical protein
MTVAKDNGGGAIQFTTFSVERGSIRRRPGGTSAVWPCLPPETSYDDTVTRSRSVNGDQGRYSRRHGGDCADLAIYSRIGRARHTRREALRAAELIEKIRRLPAGKLAKVEDFGFLRRRQEERRLAKAATGASEAAFAKVRHYSGDAASDGL